jgi:hypothetical protein
VEVAAFDGGSRQLGEDVRGTGECWYAERGEGGRTIVPQPMRRSGTMVRCSA